MGICIFFGVFETLVALLFFDWRRVHGGGVGRPAPPGPPTLVKVF